VITTKRGAAGKPKVTVSNQTAFSRPFVMPDFQNRYGNKAGEYKSWGDSQSKYAYRPADFFDTGANVQTSATLSVGTDKNQTFMSLGATSANGIIPENDYQKYNVTMRNTTKFLNDKMTLDFGFSYIKQKDQNMMAQGKYYNPLTAVYTYPRGEDFNAVKNYEAYSEALGYNEQQWTWGDQGLDMQNPYWVINRNPVTDKRDRYMMNVNLAYDILDWLNITGRARLDNAHNVYVQKLYATTNQLFAPETGRYKSSKEDSKQVYADLLLNINKYFGDYSLSANIGASISDMSSDESGIDGSLQIPNFFAISNIDKNAPKTMLIQGGWHEQTQSVFANVELGWKSMLYLTLTGRNDWASALAKTDHSSFFYPSIGLSGVISEMAAMPSFISYMKVRGSYSSVGSAIPRNLSIPTYEYDTQGGFWKTNTYMPVKDLKPERTGSWEAGLNTKFWNNRLSLDLTWYKSNTKNQTLQNPLSASTTYTSVYIQTGNVENQGVEITLGADNKWGNFNWTSTFTAGYNNNTIKLLGEYPDPVTGEMTALDYISQGGIGTSEFRLYKGGTMGDLYIKKKLKYNEDGSVVINENGSPDLENTMDKAGSVLPKWNLGFRNDFRWKDFNFGFLLSARLGGIVISPTQAVLDGFGVTQTTAIARDKGGVVIGNTTIDPYKYYSVTGQVEGLLSDYVYKAANLRLQELSIGYNLPAKWFNNVMKMNVSFVGRNLWMIYNKAPFDPEMTASTGTYFQGIDYFMQPSLRNLGFSIKLEF
jgi:TonB-linked SusC/RagA family outer membrane protein